MNGILILADDLTGANDTAIQFGKQGFSSLVIVKAGQADTGLFDKYNVISVNSDSRRLNPGEAYGIVYRIAKQFEAGFLVYKKVDSVLRGNPGQELGAVMDALEIPLTLAAPSFPANRSTLENGVLSSGTDAVLVFSGGTGRKTQNIPLSEVRKGAGNITGFINSHAGIQVFVADAVTDDDLAIIYKASASLASPHVLAGSAGLANQLALSLDKTGTVPREKLSVLVPALIIAGTRQAETAAQINALCKKHPATLTNLNVSMIAEGQAEKAIAIAFDEASACMKKNSSLCVIAVDSMFALTEIAGQTSGNYAEGDETSAAICEALGSFTEKLMGSFQFPVIITTGGDTSLAVCRQLGINAIEPLAEICPGVPLGRITGGHYDGHFIVTKSGRFGNPGSLLDIVNWETG
jgi:uncharacterized protein YgbK (DUF1537 family)